MVGVKVPTLRGCLGSPRDISIQGTREVWTYALRYRGVSEDINIDIPQGSGSGSSPPTVTSGDVSRETLKDTRYGRHSENKILPGNCVLVFDLENRAVTAFDAAGRSYVDINADDECALLARRCMSW